MAGYQPRPPQRAVYRGIQVDGLQLALRQDQKASEEQAPGKTMRQATYRQAPRLPCMQTKLLSFFSSGRRPRARAGSRPHTGEPPGSLHALPFVMRLFLVSASMLLQA